LSSPEAAIALYESVAAGKTKLGKDATTCLSMDVALTLLQLGRLAEAKKLVQDFQGFSSEEAIVHSKIYQAQMEYYKYIGAQADFYNAALMFLTYTNLDDLNSTYKHNLAQDMAVAALTGEGIYNFGEVLATPILSHLENSSLSWLQPLVISVNKGSVDECRMFLQNARQFLGTGNKQLQVLVEKQNEVMEKTSLLALVNLAFQRSSQERQIALADIEKCCQVTSSQVPFQSLPLFYD
jgi:26S proteasome regulatory subunit N9